MTKQNFKAVSFNNRKKQILFSYRSGKKITVHFGQLGIRKNIGRMWIDSETKGKSIGFEFLDGTQDYMPYDQPLAVAQDPEFLLQTHIEIMISQIKEALQKHKISKRYLAEKLHTSDNQIQRLLNPKILNKNLEQLYEVAAILGLHCEIQMKKVA